MDVFIKITFVFLFFVSIPFLLGPFLVYASQKFSAHPQVELAEIRDFSPETQKFFSENIPLLQQFGFQMVAFLRLPAFLPNVNNLWVLFTHRDTQDKAVLIDVHFRHEKLDRHQFWLEFCTSFTDHTEISTLNTQELTENNNPQKTVFIFPHIRDTLELYPIHQRLVQIYRNDRKKKLLVEGQEVEEFRRNVEEELTYLSHKGYWYYNPKTDHYHITWKGACFLTWKLAWPIGAMRKFIKRQQGKRLLKEIFSDVQNLQ